MQSYWQRWPAGASSLFCGHSLPAVTPDSEAADIDAARLQSWHKNVSVARSCHADL